MKSLAPSKTLNVQRSTPKDFASSQPNIQLNRRGLLLLFLFLFAASLHAQVGNDNPAGVSGIFNGQAGGCGYDPYTANATRSITDISVAGAVGEYPLALVRTANSRTPSTTEVFAWASGWNHNYNWILEDSPTGNTQNFHPTRYTVDFPDGRVETFQAVTWDSVYRVRPGADTPAQSTSKGVRERFVPLDTNPNHNTYMYAYLILPDGGAVEFMASQHVANGRYYYKYRATGIYDPYGLKTQLVSSITPDGLRRRLDWVIEPAGRSLHFLYTGPNNSKIAQVTASDGRSVNYYYIYCNGCRLDHVVYYNNANWTARYQYTGANVGGADMPPLLWTADDPMYAGAMKRIAYEYKPATPNNADGTTPVYGQILRERYWDGVSGHETSGTIVSTLTVGSPNNNPVYRTERRGDGATRTFIYNGAGPGYLAWVSDFMGVYASQNYDAYKYVNAVTDRRGNTTNYTADPITANVTQIKYPLTQGDTPGQSQRPTVNYTYTNSYYLHTGQDEGSYTTTFTRDSNNRVTRIDYPDGGYETFAYDPSHFYQLSSHRMTTGGTETFAYNGSNRLQYYSDPYHNNANNPSIQYFYEGHGWIDRVLDALNHPTNYDYNLRGQLTVTTLTADPVDNTRHTITNAYNPDGTLQRRTDQLSHITNYTYDDYRRVKSATPPVRGDGTGMLTTYFYYDANGTGDDYRFTDSKVTYVALPSGKRTKTTYDGNRRKSSVTVGYGTSDAATTSYAYDAVGNVARVTNPRNVNTVLIYDERNRPSEVHDPLGNITSFTYDTAGRRKTTTRPNGQVITNASFDEMNRVLQQNVTQTPDPLAVTKYTYYPSGLLNTMTDPRNSTDSYSYVYDLVGRKAWVTYPTDSSNPPVRAAEGFTYDQVGRLEAFRNRNGNYQTFAFDALNRMTGFSWNDGLTPSVSFGYDAASRLTSIMNVNATITRSYYNDNTLHTETETIPGRNADTMTYTYDADGNRALAQWSNYVQNTYTYTGRNQLKTLMVDGSLVATYGYDVNGNLTTRTPNNSTNCTYTYDALDRVTHIVHALNGTSRIFDYAYDAVGNRKWTKRDGGTGDVFRYDLADQAIGVQLNVPNPDQVQQPIQWTIAYDGNGNRTNFWPYGTSDVYTSNDLSQYTQRTRNGTPASAAYNYNGNLTHGLDGSTYTYDAQNRLLSATKSGVTERFKYDGLNRQVSRTVNGTTTYNVYDGWNLMGEYPGGTNPSAGYIYGAAGLVKNVVSGLYYYQDGSGSTSHVTGGGGYLFEWYRYDLQGTPVFYNSSNVQISGSNFGIHHLFTGQQWYSEIGLYDQRNRFYSPDIGRFLQPDPIGFRGGNNLYRYCGNNPVTNWDPFGLESPVPTPIDGDRVIVNGDPIPPGWAPGGPLGGGYPFGGGPGEPGLTGHFVGDKFVNDYNPFPRPPEDNQPSVEHPPPSSVPPQSPPQPTTTAEFIAAGNMIEHGNTMDTTPAFDLVDLFSGGIAGLVRSSVRSIAAETAATGFRYVSEGEAQIIRKTGQIPMVDRFGNAKNVFYTNESFTSAAEAQRALSLPSTPAFRIEFSLGRAPAGYGGITDPLFGQPGGGAELILRKGAAPIPVTLIVPVGE